MKYFLLLLSVFFFQLSPAQIDTTKIYNARQLKKGFYKTYEEYISNSPSVTEQFTVVPLAKNNTDTATIGATYKLADSTKNIKHIWGFCDGTDVYVKFSSSLFSKRYWRLEYIGIYPFFTFKYKYRTIAPGAIFGLTVTAAPAKNKEEYDVMIVGRDGDVIEPTIRHMKRILESHPDLLQSFSIYASKYRDNLPYNYESAQTYSAKMRLIKDYLIRLNEITK